MEALWTSPVTAPGDPLPEVCDDLVVGAGVAGLVTGLELARAGRSVCVVEARHAGSGTTGRTTGKVSLLQGTRLSTLASRHSLEVARQYLAFNRAGADWMQAFCAAEGVALERRTAVTWAASPDATTTVRREWETALELGLPAQWSTDAPAPVPSWGAAVLEGQHQLDPGALVTALVAALRRAGGLLVHGARVRAAHADGPGSRVELVDGREVRARTVVVTTGAPVLDRGAYFSRLQPQRSYLLAVRTPDPPAVMMLSTGQPSRSLRDATDAKGNRLLLVGGEGHVTGRTDSEAARIDALREWTAKHFDVLEEVAAWSAQDQESVSGLPVVGRMPGSRSPVLVATGFAKWGLTNAPAAALSLVQEVLGADADAPAREAAAWHDLSLLSTTRSWLQHNASTGLRVAQDVAGTALGVVRTRLPGGSARRERPSCGPCPHMGGILRWNDLEQTWDCPLHGSRFTPGGQVLDGPATRPLQHPGTPPQDAS